VVSERVRAQHGVGAGRDVVDEHHLVVGREPDELGHGVGGLTDGRYLLHELDGAHAKQPARTPRLREAANAVAQFDGLTADDELVFVDNITTGANAVLRSFPFGPGDEMLVTDRGRVIARLVPVAGKAEDDSRRELLVRTGQLQLPRTPLPKGFRKARRPADAKGRSLAALLEERAEGR